MSLLSELNAITRAAWIASNTRLIDRQYALMRILLRRAKTDKRLGEKIEFGVWTKRVPTGFLPHAYAEYEGNNQEYTAVGSLQYVHPYAKLEITGQQLRAQHGVDIDVLENMDSLRSLSRDDQMVLISLVDGQIERAIEDLTFTLGNSAYNGVGTGGVELTGLKAIILNSTSPYAGLDPSDTSIFPVDPVTGTGWWTPNVDSNNGVLRELTTELIGKMLNKVRRGGERPEDILVLMNNDLWTTLELVLEGQHPKDSRLAQIGFDAIEWHNATFLRDEMSPPNHIWFLNLNHLWLQIRPTQNFKFKGWRVPPKQDVVMGVVQSDLQLVCNDRHRQGVITDVASISD
ncbi:MAG: phage major capsid protein [Candidatus Bathyarchaeia archaeon]